MRSASPALPELLPDTVAALCEGLAARGHARVDGLLPVELLDALARDCDALAQAGAPHEAGIGRASGHRVDRRVRSDRIHWLEGDDPASAPSEFLVWMDALRIALNRELRLGLHEFEAHYALYPPGAGYARHRDRFRDDDARVISVVAYLNADWRPGYGGELRLHLPGGARDIAPRKGTCVLFLSADVEHEVLVTHAPRRSIAGWFRTRASGMPR
jgi:SM-20-related protein